MIFYDIPGIPRHLPHIYTRITLGKPRGNVNYIINSLRNGGKNGESHEDTDVVSCFSKEWIIPFYGTFQSISTFWLTNPFHGTFQNILAY